MRILCASRNFFPAGTVGGAQASLAYFARGFAAAGHEVAVLNVDDHAHAGVHPATGLAEYRLPLKNLYLRGEHGPLARAAWHGIDRFANRMEPAYRNVIRRFRPDVVFTHVLAGLSLAIWRAARAEGVPVVHMVHDYYPLCIRSGMRARGQNCATPCTPCRLAALRPALAAQAAVHAVIYVSDHMRRTYEAAGLFRAIPAQIIAGSYEPAAPVPPRDGPLTPGHLTLGYFGRLAPEKGLDHLLTALRDLGHRAWHLNIGGTGPEAYVADLRQLAAGLPVTFLGLTTPDAFFAAIDALIVPSLWHDPAPRVVYEAGIHQVIPVVNNVGGLPDLVDHGRRGLVFDLADSASLPQALDRLATADLAAIRAAWRADAPGFAHGAVAKAILAVLAGVVPRGDRPAFAFAAPTAPPAELAPS